MMRIAFVGAVGLPNRYGGFESFLEACAPVIAERHVVVVTCDAAKYPDREAEWRGVRRMFLSIPANGPASVLHDAVAFFRVCRHVDAIVVLGVSGGIIFPLFRLWCALFGKKLVVNVDGVEWRRAKFSRSRKAFLRLSDSLAQWCAHRIVVDSTALLPFLTARGRRKARCIAYSGDQVHRSGALAIRDRMLTICRIEPENNCHLLLAAAAAQGRMQYDFIGNWNASEYGRALREAYGDHPRIRLLDPVYDERAIGAHRERCAIYLHGHSVGGTNPSLVEMLFYDCRIIAFDCTFNRETAGTAATYFADTPSLEAQLAMPADAETAIVEDRAAIRDRYTRARIAQQYIDLIESD